MPSLMDSSSTVMGLLILTLGIFSYSFANVYFSKMNVPLSNIAINTWQVLIGGTLLIPVALLMPHKEIVWDNNLLISVFWLAIVISICTSLLWYYLLKKDTIKASQWLYLSPIMGYGLSYWLLNEPITIFAVVGTVLVIMGLYISKKE